MYPMAPPRNKKMMRKGTLVTSFLIVPMKGLLLAALAAAALGDGGVGDRGVGDSGVRCVIVRCRE